MIVYLRESLSQRGAKIILVINILVPSLATCEYYIYLPARREPTKQPANNKPVITEV
jgi:hypothetical protein